MWSKPSWHDVNYQHIFDEEPPGIKQIDNVSWNWMEIAGRHCIVAVEWATFTCSYGGFGQLSLLTL